LTAKNKISDNILRREGNYGALKIMSFLNLINKLNRDIKTTEDMLSFSKIIY